ncbi:polyprenol phosphomannose-dependent alpha 1,6 mannosyltransferase MptB [Actinoallomurus soli]|uniref:polyprenol phosphomannose-dependent alpha 1,6 mannosyltransferase MptB n=1 Tax=Actinoallomurus soli TaxID=2952535 RepID=UPI002092BD17|nr:polyprenol phosphomannose-dependent alpha 1,6 mannosyltransferase MptB [Actinoallomurus soli]MCO5970301.1 polyprenol phosphomannose-dependent alpha 1,6 mannosyltransferase MptB [Actinoallomurus soli]
MTRADRLGFAGLSAAALGLGCFLTVALLGPSVMEPVLSGGAGQPPYSLTAHPSAHLVLGLTAAGVGLSALGLGLCLFASRRGWWIRPRILLIAGAVVAVAFMFMPPIGSADHLNYAAYGRMAVTGNDPYATAPRDLPADPVIGAVQDWRNAPTLYGPIATAQQSLASLIGGDSVRLTVFVMSVTEVMAFLAVGLLLAHAARGDRDRRLRAALLWSANPLILYAVVAGAHNDVLALAFAVAGLVVFALPDPPWARRPDGRTLGRCVAAGILIGAGAAVKLNVALAGAGPGWILLREWWQARAAAGSARPAVRAGAGAVAARLPAPRGAALVRSPASHGSALARLVALPGAALVVTGLAYLIAGPHAFDQLQRASKAVALATPWHLFAGTDGGLLLTLPRSAVQNSAIVLTAVLAVLLLRAAPPSRLRDVRVAADPTGEDALRITAVLAIAWLFAAPYALPWYDGLGWATLALVPWSRLDGLLLARTSVLALAYLPARDPRLAGLPRSLDWLITDVRSRITPCLLTALLIALVVVALRSRRAPAPVRSPRAPAEPRP